jgi:hypothetical protein
MSSDYDDQAVAAHQRYLAAAHAMQTGVAFTLEHDAAESDLKHLRVGINSALVTSSALAEFLIDKGIVDRLEWYTALADAMERERNDYQRRINERYPTARITLA